MCVSVHLSAIVPVAAIQSACQSICLPACYSACVGQSVCMSACLSVCLSVCLHCSLSGCMAVFLPVCLSACQSFGLIACLSLCLYVCLSASVWYNRKNNVFMNHPSYRKTSTSFVKKSPMETTLCGNAADGFKFRKVPKTTSFFTLIVLQHHVWVHFQSVDRHNQSQSTGTDVSLPLTKSVS